MLIRTATAGDWPAIWPFFHKITAAAETFTFPSELDEEDGAGWWMLESPSRTVVAVAPDSAGGTAGAGSTGLEAAGGGTVLGTAKMNRNQAGPGSHVASASYMVDPAHQGKGVGRALVAYSIDWAREQGFQAIQFNAVVETNVHAVALYRTFGFEIVGTVPGAFRHPQDGYVGLHVMHLAL